MTHCVRRKTWLHHYIIMLLNTLHTGYYVSLASIHEMAQIITTFIIDSVYSNGLPQIQYANTQLDPSCVSAPPATNVDLFACFAERLFKSSSIIYLLCRRVANDSLYMGKPCVWSIDRTEQPKQRHIGTELNRTSRDVSSTVNVC